MKYITKIVIGSIRGFEMTVESIKEDRKVMRKKELSKNKNGLGAGGSCL
jgi:hypothetical protein